MWRWASRETATEVAKEGIKYIIPLAIPSGVGLMGWLQDIPWFYVSVGVVLSGAGIMTWLVQFDEWKSRKRVEHKLMLSGFRAHSTTGGAGHLVAVRFGINLRNGSSFPIEFNRENMRTRLTLLSNGQTFSPSKDKYERNDFVVMPDATGWLEDHNIMLPDKVSGPAMVYLECLVSYGKKGRPDYKLQLKKKSLFVLSETGVVGGTDWQDD